MLAVGAVIDHGQSCDRIMDDGAELAQSAGSWLMRRWKSVVLHCSF